MVEKPIQAKTLVKAANSNGMIQRFGTFRLSPNAAATLAKRTAAATPDTPRENRDGHARRRILIAAQFNAQPTEVTARKRKPVALADDELVMHLCLSQKGVHAAGISNLRYRCRPRRLRCWISETSRAPFRCPEPDSITGGAGARHHYRAFYPSPRSATLKGGSTSQKTCTQTHPAL